MALAALMSGGSMGYLCYRVEEARFVESTPERKAFRAHLIKVAAALKAIEWVDSGDTAEGDEHDAIMACITPTDVLEDAIKEAEDVLAALTTALNLARA